MEQGPQEEAVPSPQTDTVKVAIRLANGDTQVFLDSGQYKSHEQRIAALRDALPDASVILYRAK